MKRLQGDYQSEKSKTEVLIALRNKQTATIDALNQRIGT